MDKHIIEFLLNAKKNTYAAHGSEVASSRPNSHDLMYTDGDLKYIDTYLGGQKFAGEEAVWINDHPIWSMNYYGQVLSDKFKGDFLKLALMHPSIDNPYRGSDEFIDSNFPRYKYTCQVDGDTDFFHGVEHILYDDKVIYKCLFHGGTVV